MATTMLPLAAVQTSSHSFRTKPIVAVRARLVSSSSSGGRKGRVSAIATSSGSASRTSRSSRLICRAGNIEKINGEQLEVLVQSRDKPLIIDFYATWCGPCVLMAQELEKVCTEYGDKVRFVKVDTDEEPDLSTQLMIQGLPTLVFVGTGDKPALRTEGLLPAETIKQIIDEELLA